MSSETSELKRLRRERDEQVLRRQEIEAEFIAFKRLAREYVEGVGVITGAFFNEKGMHEVGEKIRELTV